ncbi:unnamed protein product [Paramecium sonneborni]|uniref:GOLD domain-containing protein n=1 Tax=Paramecium sonneborni TaxID=65129 RepID=A0A8S1Q240_9CILI|nr:unnamed protein product [Paramecium sonneborni]
MDPPQSRRPPIFGPLRQNRFETKCKHCKKQQDPQQLQQHERQCQQQEQGALTQFVNAGTKLIRGFSQGMQRNVERLGNAISNEYHQIERIFTNQPNPVTIDIYQEQFNRLRQEEINNQEAEQPKKEANLIEYNFINKRNLTPSAKICCICQEEYIENEKIILLQCMHRYHKQQKSNLSNLQNEYILIILMMKLIFLFLFASSLVLAQDIIDVNTNGDEALENIKKLEEQEQEAINSTYIQNDRENSDDENSKSEKEENESIDSEEQTDTDEDAQENFYELLEALRPLFGLRYKDKERDNEGQIIEEESDQENYDQQDKPLTQDDEFENVIKKVESDPLMLLWDQLMNDFDPEDLLTFELQSGSTEILYETIAKPTTIRGAYFIPQFRLDQKIDFYIKTSNNTLLYSKERVQEGIFKIDIPEKGEYKFIFTNKRTKEPLTITFAIDVHDSHQEFLKLVDLDPLNLRIERLSMAMRDNYFYDKMAAQQFEGGLREVQNANNKLLLFSLIEIIGIIAITGWQVFYLKRILSNQRII